METGPRDGRRTYLALGGLAYAVLVAVALLQTRAPFFDEPAHLAQARRWAAAPSLASWLRDGNLSAVGPLYGLLHYAISGGRMLAVPWLRAPNLVLLGFVILVTGEAIRRFVRPDGFFAVAGIMAVPMTWVVAGMALTEVPAMAGLAAAIYGALRLSSGEADSRGRRALWWGVLGAGFCVATCGRQTYLAAAPALAMLSMRRPGDAGPAVLALGLGSLPIAAVFAVWGGLTPPELRYVTAAGLAPSHAVLAFCYLAAVALLLAPELWRRHVKPALIGAAAAVAVNAIARGVSISLLTGVQRFLPDPAWGRWAETIAGQAMVAAAGAFAVVIGREAWLRRDRIFCGSALGLVALCAACAANSALFSSRYAGMALPLLLLMAAPWMRTGPWACARFAFGAAVGLAVLESYYRFAPG